MNKLVQQAFEFGLMTHFERRTKRIMHIKSLKQAGTQTEFSTSSISVKQLNFVFILYTIGVLVSNVVFAIEILVRHLSPKLNLLSS